jgi:death-on-curing protein
LLYALAKSQACSDGNKRVALLLTSAFVRMNGKRLEATHSETVAVILDAAESDASRHDDVVAQLTSWMRTHLGDNKDKP